MIEKRKKTGADLAVGGQTHAGTMAAERMRHRRNNADLAESIVKRVASRGLAGRVGKLAHGTELVQLFQDLVHSDDDVRRPHAVFFQRHELDKTDHHALIAGEAGEFDDLVLVKAAQEHAVDRYRLEAGAP